jgi:predicted SnoaL-like aldol condensation-catalyzing enzyme
MTTRSILLIAVALIVSTTAWADAKQDANKKTVREFYEAAINRKDFDAAAKYLGASYKQHNPRAADGAEGLKSYLQFMKEKMPNSHSEIKQVLADGDYVILHVHAVREASTLGQAIVDIFRLEKGKIVEHWDVIQDVPEKPANQNGMF